MPTDLGVNQESVERIIKGLTEGIILGGREIVLRYVLTLFQKEGPKAGLGYIIDNAEAKIKKALSEGI